MLLLELFKGTGSVGKVAKKLGWDVISLDIDEKFKPDILDDFMKWDYKKSNIKPDIIWASPPCTTWSVAARNVHRGSDLIPKTDEAKEADKMINRLLQVIKYFKPKWWFIENPRGKLRRLPIMLKLPRYTVFYGAYGSNLQKPTDIWTNIQNFIPKQLNTDKDFKKVADVVLHKRYEIPPKLLRELFSHCLP